MPAIVLDQVTKKFRHLPALFNWIGYERTGATLALNDVSLSADFGKVMVLVGPNGSGKTTLMKLISTMLLPDGGRVIVDGADTRLATRCVRKQVGFAVGSERSFFPRLTARENLEFFAALDGVSRRERSITIDAVLEQADLVAFADTLVYKFSAGMFQKLGIARALVKRPSVLLLDEATRSIDPGSASRLWKLIRQTAASGAAVMVATHNLEEAVAIGDTVAVLRLGKVAAIRVLGSRTDERALRDFYFQSVDESLETQGVGSPS